MVAALAAWWSTKRWLDLLCLEVWWGLLGMVEGGGIISLEGGS